MNTKKWLSSGVMIFSLFCSMLHGEVVRYVQGGACSDGTGSKTHPYSTLADAEADTSWDELVVLPSTVELDGGITLRSGTKLVGGGCDPTCISLSTNVPTITNTSDATNGGNGVVVIGDAVVEKIYFKNTWASAINYDDARDLTVKHVLITGHNMGEVVSPIPFGYDNFLQAGGIHGQPTNDGTTKLEKVVIRNNHTGAGVNNFPRDGAKRKFHATNCEFTELTQILTTGDQPVLNILTGIASISDGENTELDNHITHCYLHDFQKPDTTGQTQGIATVALRGSKSTTHISDSTFYNLSSPQSETIHINSEASVEITPVVMAADNDSSGSSSSTDATLESELKLEVTSCAFEELDSNMTSFTMAVANFTSNGKTKWSVKDCTMTNISDSLVSLILGNGHQHECFTGNNAVGLDAFFVAIAGNVFLTDVPNAVTKVCLQDNNYTGGQTAAIAVFTSDYEDRASWHKLKICAKNNCFNGQNMFSTGFLGGGSSEGPHSNIVIRARNNSIVGYTYDVQDIFAGINYQLQKNWWGEGNYCSFDSDCSTTQSCSFGRCVGPDNIVNVEDLATIDVHHPLNGPTKCPGKCHQALFGDQNVPNSAKASPSHDRLKAFKSAYSRQ
ncbi:MAG: hypothetical protein LLF94_03630 [Chlamydiales bacterium]|nr:hypothetical protein [Chlamydiales bacterium]